MPWPTTSTELIVTDHPDPVQVVVEVVGVHVVGHNSWAKGAEELAVGETARPSIARRRNLVICVGPRLLNSVR